MIGVDPHKGSHTAVAIGADEAALGQVRVRCGCRKPMRPGDIRESRPRRDRAAGPGTDPVMPSGSCRSGAACFRARPARVGAVLCPASWSRPAGGSPVRVGTGAPGSRPRFVAERWRAKRGVESLFGGSKHAGRSVKRTLQPRHTHDGGAEPLMSRRRPRPAGPGPGSACRVLPGYGGRHVCMVWAGTGETRLPGLRRAKTAGISRW